MEQHQREQTRHLGVVDHRCQPAREPDGLGGQVDVTRIALVEHEIEHPQHRRDIARPIQPDVRDRALGPADALGHRRFRNEIGLRDLPGRQPADGTQGERDRRAGRERRVGTQEVQRERVVHRCARPRPGLGVDEDLAASTGRIGAHGVEESAPRHRDQPALRVARRILRPHPQGFDERVLDGILGRREIRSAADEDADHRGDERAQQRLVHVYSVTVGGSDMNGRTSSHSWIGFPPAPGAADSSPASSSARS